MEDDGDRREEDSRGVTVPVRIKFYMSIGMERFSVQEIIGPRAAHGLAIYVDIFAAPVGAVWP